MRDWWLYVVASTSPSEGTRTVESLLLIVLWTFVGLMAMKDNRGYAGVWLALTNTNECGIIQDFLYEWIKYEAFYSYLKKWSTFRIDAYIC